MPTSAVILQTYVNQSLEGSAEKQFKFRFTFIESMLNSICFSALVIKWMLPLWIC